MKTSCFHSTCSELVWLRMNAKHEDETSLLHLQGLETMVTLVTLGKDFSTEKQSERTLGIGSVHSNCHLACCLDKDASASYLFSFRFLK